MIKIAMSLFRRLTMCFLIFSPVRCRFDTPHTPSRLPLVSPANLLITIFVRSLGRSDRGRHPITKPSHLDAVARGGAYVEQEKLSTSKVDQMCAV